MRHPEEESPEDEKLWELLKAASRQEPRGRFADDVLRRVRMEEEPARSWFSFWQPFAAGLAAVAVASFGFFMLKTPGDPAPTAVSMGDGSALVALEEDLAGELLQTAAENPGLFSDQELLAMLD